MALWPFEIENYEKNGFLAISTKWCILGQKVISVGPPVLSTLGGVTEATFSRKMHGFREIAKMFFHVLNHSRPKWGVNPNLRVLRQDAYPLKALSMGY